MKVNEKVKSINITPWGSEYSYSLDVVYDKYNEPINDKNNDGISDIEDTLKSLKIEFPNLKNISIIVGWFADVEKFDLDIDNNHKCINASQISIHPKASERALHASKIFKVGDYHNSHALQLKDNEWSGTSTDQSLMEFVKILKDLDYNVRLYPMLFVDEKQQPWRGEIIATCDADINSFFNEYDKFIEHYINLEIDGEKFINLLDSFIVGSEMIGLTKYQNQNGDHLALKRFADLAQKIHNAAKDNGTSIKVSYAANWDEYHFKYMDQLWHDENIDFIGIDAYFPLGEKDTEINYENVFNGWSSGEYYDFYYINDTKIPLKPRNAFKNLKYWYEHGHNTKPIEFTEMGAGSNLETLKRPAKWDNYNAIPSNEALKIYIEASLDYWKIQSSVKGYHNLPNINSIYLWEYDSRGPDYYLYEDLFADCSKYYTGLTLNNKLL